MFFYDFLFRLNFCEMGYWEINIEFLNYGNNVFFVCKVRLFYDLDVNLIFGWRECISRVK